jgi:dTDP-4-amino-4,6-dideoxygalactose transaminase
MRKINLFKVNMSLNAHSDLSEVMYSGYIGQGTVVDEFEDLLRENLGLDRNPITVNSGTSAIDLALELIGIGLNDEVITTPQTCFASNIHLIHRGAKIRWADIDPITGLIDTDSVKKLINEKTKAILAVNWGGRIANYKDLKLNGIPVIEDAAHNWDSFHNFYSKNRGDYVIYSFQAIKFLTTGDGGMLCVPEEKDEEARLLRWFGLNRNKGESFRCTQDISRVGFKYHMNNINAQIGISNIFNANQSVLESIKNSKYYIDKISNDNIIVPEFDDNCSYWLFSIHVLNNNKDRFMKYLDSNGIETSPVHYRNDYYSSTIRFIENGLPGVDSFTDTQVCIPNGYWLTSDDKEYIIYTINSFK